MICVHISYWVTLTIYVLSLQADKTQHIVLMIKLGLLVDTYEHILLR